MATIKSYTTIEQSRKLAEILPLESADMVYEGYKDELTNEINYTIGLVSDWKSSYPDRNIFEDWNDTFMPCWSLAALLSVLPNSIYDNTNEFSQLEFTKKSVAYIHGTTDGIKLGALKDNLVDACYEMLLNLSELNLL